MLNEGKDICTTHSLFKKANKETREILEKKKYTLVLDEVLNVIEQIPLKKNDLDLLIDSNIVKIEENEKGIKYIKWNSQKKEYDTKYNNLRNMAMSKNLLFCQNTALIWNLPCDLYNLYWIDPFRRYHSEKECAFLNMS